MTVTNYYHIGICGQVSTGKSTCLNALTGQYLSQISLKRSTKRVLKFFNIDSGFNTKNTPTDIKKIIEQINEHDAHEQTSFHIHMPICDNSNNIVLYDFPGFNDGQESVQGMEKLFIDEMINLDLIIFIVDSNSALIHKSEKDIFKMLAEQLKKNHEKYRYTKLVVAFNKFHIDDDEIDDDINKDVMDIIKDARAYIDETMGKLNKFIAYSYTYVSFRNMMIYNIFENHGNIDDISYTEFNQVLIEFYGKREAMKKLEALKSSKIHKKDLDCINLTNYEKQFTKMIKDVSCFLGHTEYWLPKLKTEVKQVISLDKTINHDDKSIKYSTYDKCIEILKGHSHYRKYNKSMFDVFITNTILLENMKILSKTCMVEKTKQEGVLYLDVLDNVLFIMEEFNMIDYHKKQLPDNIIDLVLTIVNHLEYIEANFHQEAALMYNRAMISTLFRLIVMYTDNPVNYLLYFSEPWVMMIHHNPIPKVGFWEYRGGRGHIEWSPNSSHIRGIIQDHASYVERIHYTLNIINAESKDSNTELAKQCVQTFMVYYNASFAMATSVFDDLRSCGCSTKDEYSSIEKFICLHRAYIDYKHNMKTNLKYSKICGLSRHNFMVKAPDAYKQLLDAVVQKHEGDYWNGLFETDLELVQFIRHCNKNSTLPEEVIMDINLYINEKLLKFLG